MEKSTLLQVQSSLVTQVSDLEVKSFKLIAALGENETHNQLNSLELKLRHLESNNYHLKECKA